MRPHSAKQDYEAFLARLGETSFPEDRYRTRSPERERNRNNTSRLGSSSEYHAKEPAPSRTADRSESCGISKTDEPLERPVSSNAPTRHNVSAKMEPGSATEHDLTVNGIPSDLRCPFASRYKSNGLIRTPSTNSGGVQRRRSSHSPRSKLPSCNDPISAEICGNDPRLAPPSIEGDRPAVCPIRFLDQHPPEEIAEYFENHKHEIPRSHEICVKRYQSNTESIRQLDAKYGNLVSMIQGLGMKHQSMLRENMISEETKRGSPEPTERVESWANAVDDSLPHEQAGIQDTPDQFEQERVPHFDRPLKDIRVGESPSRPWGITVPSKLANQFSISSERTAGMADSSKESSSPIPVKLSKKFTSDHHDTQHVPFRRTDLSTKGDHSSMHQAAVAPGHPDLNPKPTIVPLDPAHEKTRSPAPQMLFTGPVFIGHSTEQALTLLQQCGFGSNADRT